MRSRICSRMHDAEEVLHERKGIFDLMSEEERNQVRDLFSYVFTLPFKSHREAHFDKLSLLDCCIEITEAKVDKSEDAIKMCHEIQMGLSNDEVRNGWRVSFAAKDKSHRFFYLNDYISQRRAISFTYRPC